MDLSNLDTPDKTNSKYPGEFKHESGSVFLNKVLGIRSKLYNINSCVGEENGIRRKTIDEGDDYYNESVATKRRKEKINDRRLSTLQEKKILNIFDDKRFYKKY